MFNEKQYNLMSAGNTKGSNFIQDIGKYIFSSWVFEFSLKIILKIDKIYVSKPRNKTSEIKFFVSMLPSRLQSFNFKLYHNGNVLNGFHKNIIKISKNGTSIMHFLVV